MSVLLEEWGQHTIHQPEKIHNNENIITIDIVFMVIMKSTRTLSGMYWDYTFTQGHLRDTTLLYFISFVLLLVVLLFQRLFTSLHLTRFDKTSKDLTKNKAWLLTKLHNHILYIII